MSNNSDKSIKYQQDNFSFANGTGQAKNLQMCYDAGYLQCQQEYEEKLRWIPIEEKLPEFDNSKYPNGDFEKYEVKFCTGGMSPKYFIQISHLIRKDKFSGEFDWTRATHWRPIFP